MHQALGRATLRLAILSLLIAPAIAESLPAVDRGSELHQPATSSATIDPCGAFRPRNGPRQPVAIWRAHMTRDTAVYMLKHLQLACRRLNDFVREHREILQTSKASQEALILAGDLRARVLAAIYRAYPDLRAKDLTATATRRERDPVASSASDPATPGLMSRATALRLHPLLTDAARRFFKSTDGLTDSLDLEKAKALVQEVTDIGAEIGFANAPIYESFPDLWKADARKSWQRAATRTPETDDRFRKSVPPPGTARLSESATAYVRKFLAASHREFGQDDAVASIFWVEEEQSKGPNDADWHRSGPGLSLGAYSRRQVPADVIQTIDGLEVILSAPDPSIFVGKVIDFQDGKIQLRDP
ncbi:MAG TPA: hypothetical protein VG291_07110 [Xanthobacteraceae bacterium]|nr:hypothetical protein [Xanthobacteraceae bacterium]